MLIGRKQNNLDAIRLGMALLVVWSHSFALHNGNEEAEWIFRLTNRTVAAGTVAVMAFFVISGFLISQSWERSKSLRKYLDKRVRRIYPGYMLATTLCAFVVVPLFSSSVTLGPLVALKTLVHNLLLQNSFPASDAFASNVYPRVVNGSLWSIPIEFGCYIMVAALGLLGLVSRGRLLIAATVVSLVARVVMDWVGVVPHVGLLGVVEVCDQVLPSFLIGMVIYAYRDALPRSRNILIGSAVLALASCWIGLGHLLVAPALAYAVFYVAYSNRVFDASKYGDFSYGTYLYAFVIQQMLEASFDLSLPAFIALSMILSLVAGVISWCVIERRFLPPRRRHQEPAFVLSAPSERRRV